MRRDQVHIQSPCHADWSAMTGDSRRRHCGSCDKHVHDLSAMTEREAAKLVASSRDLCVRYAARPDGTVIHAPARRLPRVVAMAGALLAAAPALASSVVARPPEAPVEPQEPSFAERVRQRLLEAMGLASEVVSIVEPPVIMGEMAAVPPPPPPVEMKMGKVALPPAPPADPVIPEVEEALR